MILFWRKSRLLVASSWCCSPCWGSWSSVQPGQGQSDSSKPASFREVPILGIGSCLKSDHPVEKNISFSKFPKKNSSKLFCWVLRTQVFENQTCDLFGHLGLWKNLKIAPDPKRRNTIFESQIPNFRPFLQPVWNPHKKNHSNQVHGREMICPIFGRENFDFQKHLLKGGSDFPNPQPFRGGPRKLV